MPLIGAKWMSSFHTYSYVFVSSRGCGITTYQWLAYLPEGSSQFLFQAWGETITGSPYGAVSTLGYGSAIRSTIADLTIQVQGQNTLTAIDGCDGNEGATCGTRGTDGAD